MDKMYFVNDGKGIENPIFEIQQKYDIIEREVKLLIEENAHLKSEHYKDDEIKRLNDQIEEYKEERRYGFPISKKSQEKIDKWMITHECPCKDKRSFGISEYRFALIPGIGYDSYVKCNCGAEFCFERE